MEQQHKEIEVRITYETLFELSRREKNRLELQKLESNFSEDVANYIAQKKSISSTVDPNNPFSQEEARKTEGQLENIKQILKDLYDRREKKIVQLAIDASRIDYVPQEMAALLPQEKRLCDQLIALLKASRYQMLLPLLQGVQMPEASIFPSFPSLHQTFFPEKKDAERQEALPVPSSTKMVRFLHGVPQFVGPELEIFGPFLQEDIANLPTRIADLLVKKGRAEEIHEEGEKGKYEPEEKELEPEENKPNL
ncbi:DNA replication complex GINS family protein [Candidatus Woesearchaeota archaeon]|nr:DNA replication complex GINS family protein [Candidatus Woesearchaeota archaeon]